MLSARTYRPAAGRVGSMAEEPQKDRRPSDHAGADNEHTRKAALDEPPKKETTGPVRHQDVSTADWGE